MRALRGPGGLATPGKVVYLHFICIPLYITYVKGSLELLGASGGILEEDWNPLSVGHRQNTTTYPPLERRI